MSPDEVLSAGAQALGLAVDATTRQRLLDYLALLDKWNKVYNLTAVRNPRDMLTQHVLDSLAVLPFVAGRRILDVGSGAGLPGIPLALAAPEKEITLLDSNQKKTTFLQQAQIELRLPNVSVVCGRVEHYAPTEKYDTVVSRAFSDLVEFVRLTEHLCAAGGEWLAMKGVYPEDELARLPAPFVVRKVVPLTVPGLEAARHLVILGVA